MPNRLEFVLSSSIIVAVLSLARPALAQTQLSPVASDRLAYDSIEHRLSSYRHVMPEPSRLALSAGDESPAALEAYCDGEKLREHEPRAVSNGLVSRSQPRSPLGTR